jgi:hypothetical protein
MTKRIVLVAALLIFVSPCFAQKIYIDFDKNALNKDYKTYAWHKTEESSLKDSSPLMHSRIVNAIEYHLNKGGFIQVEPNENPDVFVTYHTSEKDEVQLNTSYYGYGYGGGWYRDPYWGGGWGMGGAQTTAYTYTRGTLIVDIWDAEAKELVWRGAAQAILKEKPEKQAKQIDKALAKMVAKWKNMRDNYEKELAKAAKAEARAKAQGS